MTLRGGKYIGEWKDGNFWNGTGYDKKGKRISKYLNGKRHYFLNGVWKLY
jgi:hypothetical protein